MISIEVSFHTCFKISFSSNIVDSPSFASEKGVILILSSLMSKSGLELMLADVMLDELLASGGAPEPPVVVGVLGMVSQKRTTPLTNSRGGGIVSSFQTFEFRFLSIAKTESVTFITTGDNKFVMS